jgi:glycosyltransferase involved in cell wall biosynthesis
LITSQRFFPKKKRIPTRTKFSPRISFISESTSSFVIQDLMTLNNLYPTIGITYKSLVQTPKLFYLIANCRVTVVWFASGKAATLSLIFAKILRKKLLVIAGGSEVSAIGKIRGTDIRSRVRFILTRLMLNEADYVVCPSNFTLNEILSHSNPQNFSVIYHGIDTNEFCVGNGRNDILTVATGDPIRKGIDRFLKVAALVPEKNFVIVGSVNDSISKEQSVAPNIRLKGLVKRKELISSYQKSLFYCQLSRHEAFSVALAEAMSCGCVPIVSNAGAIPEVVGKCGFIVSDGDPSLAAKVIVSKWENVEDLSIKARQRVVENFSIARRASAFQTVLLEIMGS